MEAESTGEVSVNRCGLVFSPRPIKVDQLTLAESIRVRTHTHTYTHAGNVVRLDGEKQRRYTVLIALCVPITLNNFFSHHTPVTHRLIMLVCHA